MNVSEKNLVFYVTNTKGRVGMGIGKKCAENDAEGGGDNGCENSGW